MAETNVPGIGKTNRKWVVAGGALVVGILGYAYLHRAQTVAGPDVGAEPQVGTELPPADLGSVSTGGGTTDTGLKFITTDAEWSADVIAKMGDLGFDTQAVSLALGKWLQGQNVSQQEEQWIFAAIALGGLPPSGSHPIHLEPAPPASGGTSGGTSGGKPPAQVKNLHVHKRNPNHSVSISWDRASGAVSYAVYRDGHRINIVPLPAATVGPPAKGSYTVKAINIRKQYGPASNTLNL